MPEEERHIERIDDTRANLQANLDVLQIGIETDQEEYLIYKDDGGNYRKVANLEENAEFLDIIIDNAQVDGDITFDGGSNRALSVDQAAAGAGDNLTVQSGKGAAGEVGGNLNLYGGQNGDDTTISGDVAIIGDDIAITANGDDITLASARVFVDGSLGVGIANPASLVEIWADSANPILTITGAHATDYDPQIQFRTDASPTTKWTIGVNSANDEFVIDNTTGVSTANPYFRMRGLDGHAVFGTAAIDGYSQLKAYKYTTNLTARRAIFGYHELNLTGSRAFAGYGILGQLKVTGTANNTAVLYGIDFLCRIDNSLNTLDYVTGLHMRAGKWAYAGTVGTLKVMHIEALQRMGHTNNSYDIFIETPNIDAGGTVDNDWCMYSEHDAPSMLTGWLGIGTGATPPVAEIELQAATPELRIVGTSATGTFTAVTSVVIGSITNNELQFATNNTIRGRFTNGGDFGVGASPTQPISSYEKGCMTAIGGIAIKLTNNTGVNSVQGQQVEADPANDDAVILTVVSDHECFGVFLESGVTDGSEAWIVVSGIAYVAMENNTAATHGNWVQTSDAEAGYADSTNAGPPLGGVAQLDTHMQEIGHCIETVAAGGVGTHILAKCVLHFN